MADAGDIASVDDPEVPDLDRRFHVGIAGASGNRVLASFVAALHHATEPVNYLDLSPEVGRETVKQHVRILRAIEAQDPDEAEAAMVRQLYGWVADPQSQKPGNKMPTIGLEPNELHALVAYLETLK